MYPFLDNISLSDLLDTFLECLYTAFKIFQICCMPVCLFVVLLPYRKKANILISPVLDEMSFPNLLETLHECFTVVPYNWKFGESLSVNLVPYTS